MMQYHTMMHMPSVFHTAQTPGGTSTGCTTLHHLPACVFSCHCCTMQPQLPAYLLHLYNPLLKHCMVHGFTLV
jgi:hypothetical protein